MAARSIVVARENERLVVFRLGRLFAVLPPGRNLIIPFADRVVRVNLEEIVGWQNLPEAELQERIVERMNVSDTNPK